MLVSFFLCCLLPNETPVNLLEFEGVSSYALPVFSHVKLPSSVQHIFVSCHFKDYVIGSHISSKHITDSVLNKVFDKSEIVIVFFLHFVLYVLSFFWVEILAV